MSVSSWLIVAASLACRRSAASFLFCGSGPKAGVHPLLVGVVVCADRVFYSTSQIKNTNRNVFSVIERKFIDRVRATICSTSTLPILRRSIKDQELIPLLSCFQHPSTCAACQPILIRASFLEAFPSCSVAIFRTTLHPVHNRRRRRPCPQRGAMRSAPSRRTLSPLK